MNAPTTAGLRWSLPNTEREYEIRGRDGYYVARQLSSGAPQLVVGRDVHAGGYWCEWVPDGASRREVRNQARRMIRAARGGRVELPPIGH